MIGFSNDVVCTMIFSFFLDCFFAVALSCIGRKKVSLNCHARRKKEKTKEGKKMYLGFPIFRREKTLHKKQNFFFVSLLSRRFLEANIQRKEIHERGKRDAPFLLLLLFRFAKSVVPICAVVCRSVLFFFCVFSRESSSIGGVFQEQQLLVLEFVKR